MLARTAVNRPPSPEPSCLDDWFLGAGRDSQPCSAPVPFFLEVHEELTKLWMAPFTARSCSSVSSVLTTLDCGAARGYSGHSPGGESRHLSKTDRECLDYVRNPSSLMEGTETLCPDATILNHRWLPGTCSRLLSIKPNEWMHLSHLLYPFARGVAQVCKTH